MSFTRRSRGTPPMACAIRLRMDAFARVAAFSGGVRSPPGGVLGWDERDPLAPRALDPHLVRETPAPGAGRAVQRRPASLPT